MRLQLVKGYLSQSRASQSFMVIMGLESLDTQEC